MYTLKKFKNSRIGKKIKQLKPIVLTVLFMLVLADIFLISENSDLFTFAIILVYFFFAFFYSLKSSLLFVTGIFIVFVMFILLLITGTSVSTEKAAVWLFFIILVGILQQFRE